MKLRTETRPLALFLLICVFNAMAQTADMPSPCAPCKQALVPWSAVKLEQKLITIGECTYMVTFRKRVCNSDGCQELKLEKAAKYSGSGCQSDSTSEIITLLLGKMVTENTMGFKPDSVSKGSNGCWRVIRPACWKVNYERCPDQPPPGPFNPDELRHNPGDLLPCDTANCCVNVIYPTRDQCGNVRFDAPEKYDLAWLHGLREKLDRGSMTLSRSDSAYISAQDKFTDQYNISAFPNCKQCTPAIDSDSLSKQPCRRQCPEDLILDYKRILNERLVRKR